jgi:hypothetical protein
MGISDNSSAMTGDELRARIDRLGLRYSEAAGRLGLTITGLQKQMRGERRVSRQTEIILGYLEKDQPVRATAVAEIGHELSRA